MASPTNEATHKHCHHSRGDEKSPSKYVVVIVVVEKICIVALGVFSAYKKVWLFTPYFIAGVALGTYQHFNGHGLDNNKHGGSACSQGFLEQITGVHLPVPISLAINVAITICHIDHHSKVFVPVIGLTVGVWSGHLISECGQLAFRKIQEYRNNCRSTHAGFK